jgi:hypothetical protein
MAGKYFEELTVGHTFRHEVGRTTMFTSGRSAGYPGEVDEAALDVSVDELHARPITDIQPPLAERCGPTSPTMTG